MPTSFLRYKNKSLPIHDSHMTILFQFLSKKGGELYGNEPELLKYFKNWTEDKIYHGPGVVMPYVEKFLINADRVKIFRELLDSIEKEFKTFGEAIPVDFLNEFFQTKPPFIFVKDYPVQNQIDLIREIRKFLDENESIPFPETK